MGETPKRTDVQRVRLSLRAAIEHLAVLAQPALVRDFDLVPVLRLVAVLAGIVVRVGVEQHVAHLLRLLPALLQLVLGRRREGDRGVALDRARLAIDECGGGAHEQQPEGRGGGDGWHGAGEGLEEGLGFATMIATAFCHLVAHVK